MSAAAAGHAFPLTPATKPPPAPRLLLQLGGYAFIGEGIPVGLGAAFQIAYQQVGGGVGVGWLQWGGLPLVGRVPCGACALWCA